MRAALYTRVSTPGQEEGSSLATQLEGCRQYCAERGYVVSEAHVFQEVFTGTELWERPMLTRLRDAIRHREVDVVVCHSIDRLSRDGVHQLIVLSEADHRGVGVEFVTEVIDSSPEGQLVSFVRGYAAKVEHEKIRERTIRGKRAVIASGRIHNHGPELYGYRRDKDAGVRVIHEPEAAIVRRIYRLYLEDELGLRAVALRLNADGIPSPHADKTFADGHVPVWREKSIRDIIANPAYRGESHGWRYRRSGVKRGYVTRDADEWIALAGVTPAIVECETWHAAQDRIRRNRGASTRTRRSGFVLRGLVRCGTCQRMCYPEVSHGVRRYRCSSRHLDGAHCGAPSSRADALEEWVWGEAVTMMQAAIRAGEADALTVPATDGLPEQVASLRAAVARVARSQERILSQFAASESVPWELVERQIAKGERDKAALEAEIAEIEQRLNASHAAATDQRALASWASGIVDRLDAMGEAEKRGAIEMLRIEVVVRGWDWLIVPAIRRVTFTT